MINILLLHGWNYKNYSKLTNETDAWNNRNKFVKELSKKYKIYKLNFPGFCHQEEPNIKKWTLDDYAKYVDDYIKENNLNIDYILGYSFGGAVALKYKKLYDKGIKEILISPALIRNYNKSKKFIKTPKILKPIRNTLRDFYLIKIVKVKEMVYGTKFLRNSYQNIVRIELLNELETLNPSDFIIIYGSNDTMVNPNKVINTVSDNFKSRISLINGGGHDIANTNTKELISIIDKFITKKH